MKRLAVLGALLGALALPSTADARYLSYSAGYRAAYLDFLRGEAEVTGVQSSDIGICVRGGIGRIECPLKIFEDRFVEYIPSGFDAEGRYHLSRFIYYHY